MPKADELAIADKKFTLMVGRFISASCAFGERVTVWRCALNADQPAKAIRDEYEARYAFVFVEARRSQLCTPKWGYRGVPTVDS